MRHLLSFFFFTLFVAYSWAQVSTTASVPPLIKVSGTISGDSGNMVGVTFALYAEQTGGAPLWLETQNVAVDANGRYTIFLGANHANGVPLSLFATGEAQWLGVQPEGQAEQARVQLVSVPYAMTAGDAQTLGGQPLSAFVLASAANGSTTTTASTATAAASGGGIVALATPQGTGTNVTTSGAGLANYLAKFTSATNVENSSMVYDTGTAVGIGTTTPAAMLNVVSSSSPAAFVDVYSNSLGSIPVVYRAARGSSTGPSQVTAGDIIGGLAGRGYFNYSANPTTGAFSSGGRAGIIFKANTAWTDLDQSTYINFNTTPSGSTTQTVQMVLTNAGSLGIGTQTPSANLEVNGNIKLTAGSGGQMIFADGSSQSTAFTGTGANGGVTSFNGRTGAVTPAIGDYSFSQVSGMATDSQLAGMTASKLLGAVPIASGGTNATTAAAARTNLGAAASGANSDITSLSGLTTPLSVAQGGTGAATQNFVDLTSTQTNIGGSKTFNAPMAINTGGTGLTVSGGSTGVNGTGSGSGLVGYATGIYGIGVAGQALSASGATFGVLGQSNSTSGVGVYGINVSSSGSGVLGSGKIGVYGSGGTGVYGYTGTGIAGVFTNVGGGKILSGQTGTGEVEVFSVDASGNVTSAGALLTSVSNSSGGTTNAYLAKLAGGLAVQAATSDTAGIVGVVVSGGGTSGSAEVAVAGQSNCVFDGDTTAGDYVQASGSTGGACHDSGATYPSTGQVLGRVLSTNSSAGTYEVYLFGPEQRASSASATNFSGLLAGDVTGTQSATSVVKVNGGAIPVSAAVVGTNGSGQFVAQAGTLSNSISGNAATVTNGAYINTANNFTAAQAITATGTTLTTSGGTTGLYATGSTYGLYGTSPGTSGSGVYGYAYSSSGSSTGTFGMSESSTGMGVTGTAASSTGANYGVLGQSYSTSGTGVYGYASSASGANYGVYGQSNSSAGIAGVFNNQGGGKILSGQNNYTEVFSVSGSGDISMAGCLKNMAGTPLGGGIGTCSSDMRLKTDIVPFAPVLGKLVQLRPVHYRWRVAEFPEYHFGEALNSGLLAQEVEKVFPEMVGIDGHGYKTVNYSELPYLLLGAVRELKAENDSLQAKLSAQTELVRTIESRLAQLEQRQADETGKAGATPGKVR